MTRIGSQTGFRARTAHGIGFVLVLPFFILFTSGACKKKEIYLEDDVRYFRQHLKASMDYDDIVESFGEPPIDLNAANAEADGLHIYQYPIMDSAFVRIGFTDRMAYACLVDHRNNLIEDVIVIEQKGD